MTEDLKIIKIKCPYSVRDLIIEEACGKTGFYCTLKKDSLHLNREHMYFYQVQGTMAITGTSKCDFVIWSSKSMIIENILFDRKLWQEVMLPQLQILITICSTMHITLVYSILIMYRHCINHKYWNVSYCKLYIQITVKLFN